LINKFEIFYDSKKHGEKLIYISRDKVSSVILDSTSKPSINDVDLNKTISDDKSKTLYVFSDASLKDSTYSPSGIYVSGGIGLSNIKDMNGFGVLLSASFAHESQLLSLTYMGCTTIDLGGLGNNRDYMRGNYLGILFGEAARGENGMLSVSAGIATSEITYSTLRQASPTGGFYDSHNYSGISCPIEIKGFLLAYNVIGIGFHYSLNLTPGYCPSTFTICLVFGAWNIER
jgi:hypothetical protein